MLAPTIQPGSIPSAAVQNSAVWIAQSTPAPTKQLYGDFQAAYSLFNQELFDGILPECLITLQRTARSFGFFCSRRFLDLDGNRTDEIALNPSHFEARTDVGVLSTLAHEMAHLAQYHFGKRDPSGKRGRAGYHDREWGRRMIAIGLQPSATGEPGGPQTGYQMTHYIIERGPFDIVTARLFDSGFRLSWVENSNSRDDLAPVKAPRSPDCPDGSHRWKYTCPSCGLNLWGKPNAPAACWKCRVPMPRSIEKNS